MSFKLPEQEIEELRKLQRNVIGLRYYARVTCILMLALDFSPGLVAQSLGIDVATVYRYKNHYVRGKQTVFWKIAIRVIGDVLRVGRSACFSKSWSDIFIVSE